MNVTDTIRLIENNTNKVNHDRGQQALGSDRLDKHAFLQLLMAKLKFQDPLNPTNDEDFLTQQAQLQQVESMNDMNRMMQSSMILSQASNLVGKTVDVVNERGDTVTGQVQSASIGNNSAGLLINGKSYSLDQVKKIYGNVQ
jgi:flagellar basal-body rod modification protein FlgD